MNPLEFAIPSAAFRPTAAKRVASLTLALLALAALSACGDKVHKPGQALASVNGEDVTVLQLNEEMQRANIAPAQQEAASKQLLESLIDRQLLQNEAAKEKIDRDPKVVQAIERAKAIIVAQAYMQKHVGVIAKPSKEEVADYYAKNSSIFANNKLFEMRELAIASSDITPELKTQIDASKSLEEVATWMEAHKLKFARTQLTRASTDLPPELNSKLLTMAKGQLFIVREGERSLLITIADIKDAPISLDVASPRIEQFLYNQKNKAAADAELARVRAAAKIEYYNKLTGAAEKSPLPAVAPAPPGAASAPASANGDASSTARGVAGLK